MWEYNVATKEIEDPKPSDFINMMNEYGMDNWEIFSVRERTVREWNHYGEQHKTVEYTLCMKRKFQGKNK